MRAAIYARVSTADGRQDAENQLSQLRQFVASQKWEIIGEYIDHESGKTGDRREFKRLFADAEQRHFDVILFWALDRFTREGALETLQYLNQLSSYGVGFRSFTESYLDSCGLFKDAIIAILGAVAKQDGLLSDQDGAQGRLQAVLARCVSFVLVVHLGQLQVDPRPLLRVHRSYFRSSLCRRLVASRVHDHYPW